MSTQAELMSDAIDDIAPIFTVTCPARMTSSLRPLLAAIVDVGELSGTFAGANFDIHGLDIDMGPVTVSGESEPVLAVYKCLDALGYTVKVSQVTA